MPIIDIPHSTGPDMDRNGHLPRRGASKRQDASIATSLYPIVTRTAYEQFCRGVVVEELSNLRLRRLCHARNLMGQALTALANVQHDHREAQPGLTPQAQEEYARIFQVARATHARVEKCYLGWALEVR